jgi:hypothetical protein
MNAEQSPSFADSPMYEYLKQCRSSLEVARKGRKTGFLGLGKREVHFPIDFVENRPGQFDDESLATIHLLLREGHLVWGAIAQANHNAFVPGRTDVPANVIFSLDTFFDSNPEALKEVAHRIYGLKNASNVPPRLAALAGLISDEMNFALNVQVPAELTGGKPVFFTSTHLYRRSLPNTVLSEVFFPLLVLPDRTTANLLLPLAYWSPSLVLLWNQLFSRSRASVPPPPPAPIAPSGPPDPQAVEAYLKSPVRLTSDAAQAAHGFIREFGTLENTSLWVNIRPNGLNDITLVNRPFPEVPFPVETVSDGIGIVISGHQAADLQGLRIGFKRSSMGNGFTFE